MGRELRRKEAKKNKKQLNNDNVELDAKISLVTLLKLVFFIILLLLVIYYVLAVFVTKEIDISNKNSNTEETSGTTNTVSDRILASNIFNQTEDTYYVYFYDYGTESENDLSSLISGSIDNKLYKVDTSSGLNSKYVTDENGNKDAKDIDDLKVVSNTLIKIEDDKIVEYFEGKNNIMSGIKD